MTAKRATTVIVTAALLRAVYVSAKRVDWRGYASALAESLGHDPAIGPDLSRDVFASVCVDPPRLVENHTHPTAAGLRTSATNFAEKVAAMAGARLFVSGMSRSDQRKGLTGSRQWYWAKDTNVENRMLSPEMDDIEYICDVDYYLDMDEILASVAIPRILYTCVPEQASSQYDDMSLCFDNAGRLVTRVAGGGQYRHHLWDYAADSMLCTATWFGIPHRVVTYAVERKQVSQNRQMVLLAPIKIFDGLSALIAYWLLDGKRLQRFDPLETVADGSKFVRFNVMRKDGLCVTTARPDSHVCATVTAELDDSIATVARLGTTNLMLPTTASWLDKQSRGAAAVLTEYHRLALPSKRPTVYPVDKAVRAYQYEPEQYDQEAKPKLAAFMNPLVHGAFAPVANDAGERRCVEGRIKGPQGPEPKPHAFRDRAIVEFVDLLLGDTVLEPVCYETVESKQTTPAQKLSLRKAVLQGPAMIRWVKCFIKAEAYPDVKDPRNITTYNDLDKLSLGQYALALSEHCKQFKWYGPGKTPKQQAHRVAEICMNAEDGVNISDLWRMDGTVKRALCQVDRVAYMKAFVRHRGRLNELLKRQVDNKGVLPHGTTFDQGPTHGSGRSDTSLIQTLRKAYTSYLAYRHTTNPVTGKCYTPRDAFDALGIHYGDDGVDADLPVRSLEWACERVGLVLEANFVPRCERGVNFLARYYSPEVWQGCPDSMCDVRRQLAKFHTTVRLPANVTAEQKAVEKCMAYSLTDGNTPVIGPFCKRMLVLSPYRPRTPLGVGHWWSRYEESEQFPNDNVDGWMDVEFNFLFEEFDRSIYDQWLASTKSVEDLLRAPLCAEPRPAKPSSVDVVVDDQVVEAQSAAAPGPAAKEEDVASVASSTPSVRRPRRRNRSRAKAQKEKSPDRDGAGKRHRRDPRGGPREALDRAGADQKKDG